MNEAASTVLDVVKETKSILHVDDLSSLITWTNLIKVLVSLVTIIIFYVVYRVLKKLIVLNLSPKLKKTTVNLISSGIKYTFYALLVMYILGLFGVNLSAIWGAAGIAGVAIGFAAQTSVSNLISGLFVLTEKTMKIGDFIEIDGISGTVDSISMLCVKIHTPDNQLIRIPNSSILNNKLKNFCTYKYRRHVTEFCVDYGSDLNKVVEVISKVPEMCPTVINKKDYEPKVYFTEFCDSGIKICLAVWFERQDLIQTRSDVIKNIIKVCNDTGINIPFNRIDVTLLSDKTIPQGTII